MSEIHPILKMFLEPGDTNVENMKFPKAFVEKMLDVTERSALEKGHNDEREEIVCRLLASGMAADDISLVLKLRADNVLAIEKQNGEKVKDYAKKLKARKKSREMNRS